MRLLDGLTNPFDLKSEDFCFAQKTSFTLHAREAKLSSKAAKPVQFDLPEHLTESDWATPEYIQLVGENVLDYVELPDRWLSFKGEGLSPDDYIGNMYCEVDLVVNNDHQTRLTIAKVSVGSLDYETYEEGMFGFFEWEDYKCTVLVHSEGTYLTAISDTEYVLYKQTNCITWNEEIQQPLLIKRFSQIRRTVVQPANDPVDIQLLPLVLDNLRLMMLSLDTNSPVSHNFYPDMYWFDEYSTAGLICNENLNELRKAMSGCYNRLLSYGEPGAALSITDNFAFTTEIMSFYKGMFLLASEAFMENEAEGMVLAVISNIDNLVVTYFKDGV